MRSLSFNLVSFITFETSAQSLIWVVPLCLAILFAHPLHSQDAIVQSPAGHNLTARAIFMAWKGNSEVRTCGVCHYEAGNEFAFRDNDFCRLDELKQWLQSDKHAIARQRVEPIAAEDQKDSIAKLEWTLGGLNGIEIKIPGDWIGESNSLSLAICERLGYDVRTEEGYGRFRDNCLTCHGGYEIAESSESFQNTAATQPGIRCNFCHQEGNNSQWIDAHGGLESKAKWRLMPTDAKSKLGMRELTSVDSQARLCFQCHIGDLQRNRFVTHQMYAAGHPPMPNVEIETLVSAMPRHWRTPVELHRSLQNDSQRDQYFKTNFPQLAAIAQGDRVVEELPWRVDAIVAGGLTAEQQWMKLILQAAEPQSTHWGDYALFDCAACHHEVRVPSLRQSVRAPGSPGRPRLLEWPQALTRASALALNRSHIVPQQIAELSRVARAVPFGERRSVSVAAKALDQSLQTLRQELRSERLSIDFARRFLIELAQTPDEVLVDYYTARQLSWAIRGVDADLAALGNPFPKSVREAVAVLGNGRQRDTKQISLMLPSGIDSAIYPTFLRQEFELQTNFDASLFIEQLNRLESSLREPLSR